jgi:hypothetical protein
MPADTSERTEIIRRLNSYIKNEDLEDFEVNQLVLAVRDSGEERWRVLESFTLRG